MKYRHCLNVLLTLLLILAAFLLHYKYDPWGFYRKTPEEEAALRMALVHTAESYLGCKEADGSHKPIIDLYNSHQPLAMDYTVTYTDSWCSAFASAAAIGCGLTDIIPTECGCERQIGLFRELGCWEERDTAIPLPGDLIFYDWEAPESGDCTGWSDHVGIVVGTKWPFVKVIEGNKDDCVSYRILLLGSQYIRGYGKPDYASKAKNTP